jgi:hypothetical protein
VFNKTTRNVKTNVNAKKAAGQLYGTKTLPCKQAVQQHANGNYVGKRRLGGICHAKKSDTNMTTSFFYLPG